MRVPGQRGGCIVRCRSGKGGMVRGDQRLFRLKISHLG
jgi:hypothetical protein